MRGSRWLILAAIAFIVVALGWTYYQRIEEARRAAPAPPPKLRAGVDAAAGDWVYRQTQGDRTTVEVRAKGFEQVKEPNQFLLNGVELKVFHQDGKKFDMVRSAKADFDVAAGVLFSDGDVDIEMGRSEDPEAEGRHLVRIRTSGVRLETKTQKASTERAATFAFESGDGAATGVEYDPGTRELRLKSAVLLHWRGKNAQAKPMRIEAGEASYREREAKVYLRPWTRLDREALHVEGADSVVTIEKSEVRSAVAQAAKGVHHSDNRKVNFEAEQLALSFGEGAKVEKITGERKARLESAAATSRTIVNAGRLDLDFDTAGRESALRIARATGNSVLEAWPVERPGVEPPETRVLRSETIILHMQPGGEYLDRVETGHPGTLEFLPNRPTQAKRFLRGERIWIHYGEQNRIRDFRSIDVSTRTEAPAKPPTLTSSKTFLARFDGEGKLEEVEQSTDFRYEEGDRRARAVKAVLDQKRALITLDGSARVWDSTGSADADRIVLSQKDGGFVAEGNVASTRLPDRKPGNKEARSGGLLSEDEPLQARARKMVSADKNTRIHYEGEAVAWQGANRLNADVIDIDRTRKLLEARGRVVSQLVDRSRPEDGPAAKPRSRSPVFTTVQAPEMSYSDEQRIAHYRGGAVLRRPDLTVTAREIRAFLKDDKDSESSLDKAFADGAVRIVQSAAGRTRIGTAEHAEYFTGEERVILEGGQPRLQDSLKGNTQGRQLIWFANNDRLIVNGQEGQPAESNLRRKP
jgi:lipopolysaccharide export system protein LptA